jgi:hypothetical protein
MRQFFRCFVLIFAGFFSLLLCAEEKKLSKSEIRLSRLYFQEKYSKLYKKSFRLSKKINFDGKPLIFFYVVAGLFYEKTVDNVQKKKKYGSNLSSKALSSEAIYHAKIKELIQFWTLFLKKDIENEWVAYGYFLKKELEKEIYGELSYLLSSPMALQEQVKKIREWNQYYLALHGNFEREKSSKTLYNVKIDHAVVGALFLKSTCEIFLKDPNAKNTILFAYAALQNIQNSDYLFYTDQHMFFLGIDQYIALQTEYGAHKEIKKINEKLVKIKNNLQKH